jgi:beta-glucosidase
VIADHRAAGRLPTTGPLPFVRDGDLRAIATRTDFLGVNYYSRSVVRSETVPDHENLPRAVDLGATTDMGWEVHAEGLRRVLHRVHEDYRPRRIYVTENGAAYATAPDADGRIRDVERQRYLAEHLAAAHQAIAEGVPLAGFFVWSLLDNFEWQNGLTKRFGIFWVDYATQTRIAKDSAHLCRRVARQNALSEQMP